MPGGSSSTGCPKSRHSRRAIATTDAREIGSYGTVAKGGTCASGAIATAAWCGFVTGPAQAVSRARMNGATCLGDAAL